MENDFLFYSIFTKPRGIGKHHHLLPPGSVWPSPGLLKAPCALWFLAVSGLNQDPEKGEKRSGFKLFPDEGALSA